MQNNCVLLLTEITNHYITMERTTSWNYYVTDHLGSTRMVVCSNDSIRETISYYPFGSEMTMEDPAQMSNNFQHPYRFTGKELDRVNGLNMYDFGARWFDGDVNREEYAHIGGVGSLLGKD